MYFEIISEITNIQTIAVGSSIHEIKRLRKQFGHGRWRKLRGKLLSDYPVAGYEKLNYTGMKRTALASGKLRSSATCTKMKTKRAASKFVVCVRSDDSDDLEIRKIYQVIPDEVASADGLLRIGDESGEDYLYAENFFLQIELPQSIEKA